MEDVTDELVAIESFQISQLSRCLEKLDAIPYFVNTSSPMGVVAVCWGWERSLPQPQTVSQLLRFVGRFT